MNAEILKIVGQIAGIGGIAFGVLLLLFKEVIRKNIFPNLTKIQGFKIIKLILLLVWSIAIIGIVAWFFLELNKSNINNSKDKQDTITNQTEVEINGNENTILNKPEKSVTINNNYNDSIN